MPALSAASTKGKYSVQLFETSLHTTVACLSLLEICPDCDECASAAITADRLPFRPASAPISPSAWENVCTVTAMISSPFFNAVASRLDFDFSPAVRTSSGLMVATILPVPSICRIASCKLPVEHRAVDDHDHGVEDLLVVDVPWRQAMRGPGNGVRLAGAGRLLDQVALDDVHFARRRDDLGQG